MKKQGFVVFHKIETNAVSEDEFVTIFNDKLAALFLLYEKMNKGGCNDTETVI